ncbi:MAG: endonuclease [Chloroflexi bacterium]|nr:endonuclease [Chloroflexota bacterium]
MVGAVLTQAASWKNVEMALGNLKAAGVLSPESIRRMDGDELAALLYPSGYYNSKAKKLKSLAQFIGDRFSDSVERLKEKDVLMLREELLGIHGVGRETADAILLYAVGKARFVVDNYTKRILSRIGAIEKDASYSSIQRLFEENLAPEIEKYSEYHALLVRHGNSVCTTKPTCDRCCLADLCETGRRALGT